MEKDYLIRFQMAANKDLPAAKQRETNNEAIAKFFAETKEMRAKKCEAETGSRDHSEWGGNAQRLVFLMDRCLGQTGT